MGARTYTELRYDLFNMPVIIGKDAVSQFNKLFAFVYSTRNPCSLIGDPGCGKTYTGKKIAERYAQTKTLERLRAATGLSTKQLRALALSDKEADQQQFAEYMGKIEKCRAFYAQCDIETMRTTFIGGVVFEDGSEVSVLEVVAHAMKYGHVVFIDEFGHGDPSIQTMLNSVMDNEAIIAIGNILVERHPDFRIFIGRNRTKHAGNYPTRPSTASRLVSWPFDYPSAKTETEIAWHISTISIGEQNIKPPISVYKYMVSWAREIRSQTDNNLPVTARNVAAIMELCSISTFTENAPWPAEWQSTTSARQIREKVAEWIFFAPVSTSTDLNHKEINEVLNYIAGIGRQAFIDMVLQCAMYHEHIEGIDAQTMKGYQQIEAGSIC